MTETKRDSYSRRERLFSPSHLPRHLIIFALLIIVTNFYLILIGQPIVYWVDYGHANSDVLWIQQLLAIHPLAFFGVTTIYLLIISLVLRKLPTFHALILWMIIGFIHLRGIAFSLSSNVARFINLKEGVDYPVEVGLFIIVSGILGLVLGRALPIGKTTIEPSPDVPSWRLKFTHRATIVFVIAWLLLLTAGLVQAMSLPEAGWYPISSEKKPPPRTAGKLTYDSNRRRAVLFSGGVYTDGEWEYERDTWEWDGSNWEQRLSDNKPPGRINHALAYDPVHGNVVLFGGQNVNIGGNLDDTWVWDGEQWEQQYPQVVPLARRAHSLVYDPQRGGVVLYGGTSGESNFFYDAWLWNDTEWLPLIVENQRATSGHALAYHEKLNSILVAQMWLWQDKTWSQLQSNTEPPARRSEGLVYDPVKEQMVLFGGFSKGENFNDTWLLEEQIWKKLDSPLAPSARWGHAMFYDIKRGNVVIFGGSDEEARNDMWELILPDSE